jgi:hypothetical protein
MSPLATLALNGFFVWLAFPVVEYRRELGVALRHYFHECHCGKRWHRCPELARVRVRTRP